MYKVIIGLEVHCEVKTDSKNFSKSKNTYSAEPNIHVSPVDLGLPGILPVPNKEAVRKALKTAMALHCTNPDEVLFDRKNYFYPDLPKGYQITQVTKPMGINGYVMIHVDGKEIKVDIHQLHLEEDTASLDHYGNFSLIDYNRSGIPLMEIVTEPCMHSAEEAVAFLEELRSIFLYCEVSDARTDRGQMRCDVNISLMEESSTVLGTKVEMKNINSFGNVKETILYEIKRQTEILKSGGKIIQETRRYDDEDCCTYSMRTKVDAVDYKYFIEPNIPRVPLEKQYLEEIKKEIPMLPYDRMNYYMDTYDLSRYDSTILVKDKDISDFFEETVQEGSDAKLASNWITSIILGHLNKKEQTIGEIFLTPKMLKDLIDKVTSASISSKQGKEILYKTLTDEIEPIVLIEKLGMSQTSDEGEIRNTIIEVLNEQEKAVEEYKEGKTNVVDFLVGQVMRKTRGKANPTMTMELLKKEIEKR